MRAVIIKILVRIFALFPLSILHSLGTAVGVLLYKLPNRHSAIARRNIELCFPSLTTREQEVLIQDCLVETGKTALEVAAMLLWKRQRVLNLVVNISGLDDLQKACDDDQGVIIALLHLGSWELVNLYCSMHYPITGLYSPLKISSLDEYVKNARQRFGSSLVATNREGIRSLLQALNKRKIIFLLPDQDPGNQGSVFSPFFGLATKTMTLLPRLANKTGSKVVMAYAERLPKGRGFQLHFKQLSETISSPDIENATHYLSQMMEDQVRCLPSQYQWTYKRFKSRPNNEEKLY
jgi:KDO2-lipid IV(A) lauroyltransferase